ncbi:MAG: terminase small subunit [Patescibacteria group bacterium]
MKKNKKQKHPGGRPSLYKQEYIDMAEKYIQTCERDDMHLPKIESLTLLIGVNRDTLYEWKKKHKEFSDTLEKIMTLQKIRLIDDGIYGGKRVNCTIVKLLLENNHGMREKSSKDLPLGGEPIPLIPLFKIKQPSILGGDTKLDNK